MLLYSCEQTHLCLAYSGWESKNSCAVTSVKSCWGGKEYCLGLAWFLNCWNFFCIIVSSNEANNDLCFRVFLY